MTDYDLTSLESLAQHPVVKTWLAVMECVDNLDVAHVISAEMPEKASSGWTVYDPTNFEDPLSTTHCFEVHRVHLEDFASRLYLLYEQEGWCGPAVNVEVGREAVADWFNDRQWNCSHLDRLLFIQEMCWSF